MPHFEFNDEEDDADLPEHRSSETAADANRALVEAALKGIDTSRVRRALASTSPQLIVITTPSPAWSTALVGQVVRDYDNTAAMGITERRKDGNKWVTEGIAARIEAGHHVVLCVHDTSLVPPPMLAAADICLELPAVDARLVRRAIRIVTGAPVHGLTDVDIVGLDLPDLVLALRAGSSAKDCRERLRRASGFAAQRVHGVEEGPRLEALPLAAEIADWAHDLVSQLDAVAAGTMQPDELRHGVLCGPPGTGKTLIAGAIARSAGWTFHAATIGEWFTTSDGNLGGVSKACSRFFDDLLADDRAIGFLDELDALPNRATLRPEDLQWWSTVINLMLTQVDRLRASGRKVLLLSATNYYERLDAALVRPGRLEQRIAVLPPRSAAELRAVFEHYLLGEIGSSELAGIIRFAMGATPAAVASWVRAARAAARQEGRGLELRHLVNVVVPPDSRSPEEVEAVALHEAGHAVVARLLGIEVDSVTTVSQGIAGGVTRTAVPSSFPNRAEIEDYVTMLLAGRAADVVLGSKGAHAGAAMDLSAAVTLLTRAHSEWGLFGSLAPAAVDAHELLGKVEQHLQRLLDRARRLVQSHRKAVKLLARTLVEQRLLSGAEVDALIGPLLVCASARTADLAAEAGPPSVTEAVSGEGGDAKLA